MTEYESEFIQLVMGIQGSAWMLLGKIANPITGTQEKNLPAAKSIIDSLLMLKEKTKGNLSKAEQSVLDGAIQQLQLNYVDELGQESVAVESDAVPKKSAQEPAPQAKASKKPSKKTSTSAS